MPCLDDNRIVAYSQGALTGVELSAAEAHIDTCEDCAELACEATRALTAEVESATDMAVAIQRPVRRGDVLGRYIVLGALGFGGMGEVYAAYDPELDRRVAVKLLKWHVEEASSRARSRIIREAKALAKLSHPNVVSIYDIGIFGGRVFIAMDHIEGQTLREWLHQEPRPWRAIREVLVAAGRGLVAAHDAGIVHRDFKPTNVLIAVDGRVLVLDFGLACATEHPKAGVATDEPVVREVTTAQRFEETLTSDGETIGTPAYMAPEQLRGEAVGPRTDQFSFCLTAFEALHGFRPLEDDARQVPKGGAAISASLHRAILRGLSPRAADRYSSMRDLLDAMLADQRSRKKQWSALLGAMVLSGAISAGTALLVRPEPTPAERETIDILVSDARAAAQRGYFVYPPFEGDEATAYRRVLDLEAVQGAPAEVAVEEAAALRQEFSGALTHLGDLYWAQPGGKPFAADYYAAAVLFDPSNADAQARCSLTTPELASLRARAEHDDFDHTERLVGQALAALAESDERERTRKIRALAAQDRALSMELQLQKLVGEEPAPRASQQLQPPLDEPPVATVPPGAPPSGAENDDRPDPDSARPLGPPSPDGPPPRRDRRAASEEVARGRKQFRAGRLDEAQMHFHRALQHNQNDADALGGLSEVHFERGAFGNAIAAGEQAVARAPKRGNIRLLLGDAYFKARRYDDARRQYEQARSLGSDAAAQRIELLDAKLGR